MIRPRMRIPILLAATLWLAACSGSPQLPSLPANGVILAFGDSLTYGTGAAEAQSYPADLARLSRHPVINAGVPGETSAEGAARLPALLDKLHPSLLILCHGGNDILQRLDAKATAANLRTMIGEAQRRGIPVVLIGVPRPGLLLHAAGFYARVAGRVHIPIEDDILAYILRRGDLKSDDVHPNAKGYRLLATAVYALLKDKGALG